MICMIISSVIPFVYIIHFMYLLLFKVVSMPSVGFELMTLRSESHALLTEPNRYPIYTL